MAAPLVSNLRGRRRRQNGAGRNRGLGRIFATLSLLIPNSARDLSGLVLRAVLRVSASPSPSRECEEHGGGHFGIGDRYDVGFARLKAGFVKAA